MRLALKPTMRCSTCRVASGIRGGRRRSTASCAESPQEFSTSSSARERGLAPWTRLRILAQEIHIELFQNAHHIRDNPRGWIIGVAVRKARRRLRKEGPNIFDFATQSSSRGTGAARPADSAQASQGTGAGAVERADCGSSTEGARGDHATPCRAEHRRDCGCDGDLKCCCPRPAVQSPAKTQERLNDQRPSRTLSPLPSDRGANLLRKTHLLGGRPISDDRRVRDQPAQPLMRIPSAWHSCRPRGLLGLGSRTSHDNHLSVRLTTTGSDACHSTVTCE